MMKPFHSLSRRIVLQFCLFTLILSILYALASLVLAYEIEDHFIEQDMVDEGNRLITIYERTGSWPGTSKDEFTLHFSKQSLPLDIRQVALDEPRRTEFYGENGLHYHLYTLPHQDVIYLLAEVSGQLQVRSARANIIRFFVIFGTALTLLACYVAWRIGRKTAAPLKQLSELVDGVAPENVPAQFAHHYPNNEIGVLANTLERSLLRLNNALEREKNFTRDVSHELRTPLAIIKNAAELQPDSALSQRIVDATQQMENTVHTLLVLAREEYVKGQEYQTDLMPIVEQSVIDHSRLLEGKPVEVHVDDSCKVILPANTGMLKVLLDNLLSNAFQHTNQGEVSIYFHQGVLIVEDTGTGIEPPIIDRITQPAVKGAQSTGFGFGLSIVTRLCEHQGWQLDVHSEKGTRVCINLAAQHTDKPKTYP